MSPIRWNDRTALRDPVLLVAFEGWNDAGDAATGAVRWLADRTDAQEIGRIDAEEFFDFTSHRPIVTTESDGSRRIIWPDTDLLAATTSGRNDLVFLVGPEPHLRWRTYCAAVDEIAETLGASMVLSVGALLADVPHTFPTRVTATATDASLRRGLDLATSDYQGPTGIIGVLHAALAASERPSASLWATVPNYVSGVPSPKATLALVERCQGLLGVGMPTTDLQIAAASYERQLDELIAEDEDTAAYVAGLEESMREMEEQEEAESRNQLAETDPQELVEEVERFLRGDT